MLGYIPDVVEEDCRCHHDNATNAEVDGGIGVGEPLKYSTAGIIKQSPKESSQRSDQSLTS